jgi:aspartokinase
VTADKGKMLLTVELARPTVLSSVWDRARQAHLTIVAPMFSEGVARFFIEKDAEPEWRKQLEELSVSGFVRRYQIDENLIPVSVVGHRFSQDGSALAEVMDALSAAHINVTVGSASALAITVAALETHADDAVKTLHDKFLKARAPALDNKGIS